MEIYKRLLRYAYPYRFKIAAAFVCNVLGGLFSLSSMVLIKPVIDKIFNNPDQAAVARYMVLLPLAIILVMVFKAQAEVRNREAQRRAMVMQQMQQSNARTQ